jgi:cytochrome c553
VTSLPMQLRNYRVTCVRLCSLAIIFISGIALAASHYTDLRRIEPIKGDPVAGEKIASTCYACHGSNGVSVAPMFPRLAGQRADYLYHRLVSFGHADPKDPYYSKSPMTSIAANLKDVDMRNLAAYFSMQLPPVTDAGKASETPHAGKLLFLHGDPTQGVPPCQGCHGADANGPTSHSNQYAAYPSLRGQYAQYLVARLTGFRSAMPADTSNAFIMAGVAHTLDGDSLQAVAEWLSSLAPERSL